MRQGDLTRPRPATSPDQPGVADGVMRGAEGSLHDERRLGGEHAADAVDLRDLWAVLAAHSSDALALASTSATSACSGGINPGRSSLTVRKTTSVSTPKYS